MSDSREIEGMVLLTTPSFVAGVPDIEIWMTEEEYDEQQRVAKEAERLFKIWQETGVYPFPHNPHQR